jgi:hypothetical protein
MVCSGVFVGRRQVVCSGVFVSRGVLSVVPLLAGGSLCVVASLSAGGASTSMGVPVAGCTLFVAVSWLAVQLSVTPQ